ncbi:molybdopterin synthase sulfur carrier subunit [Aeromonas simiae]|uniref:Molybdopterin synthase sulfur carrier subunit n=1 Tax=Aeromonas simiae TaxID=218936 RepID=A0A5J6WY02_9GAMM|nr:molybdopterin synthase sulfur carrier subunit [Aeromonas simiae]MDO2948756.1 molybdopterin synthase sulfur carrier subunit [Aeromonas simiae]MDO2951827.1 molybdopterin synthase sulfur carrier subunit [Aeromonas simiae]MDO2956139.1 molybdopterin synthase sulfur carrier subunit [Aeromonas simiae]QFI54967.1 molybdopterin synthase sulfur carrier subunit [Aeromonas simiae]
MIQVLFFAQVRELVGCDALAMPDEYTSAEALRAALAERGDKWALALEPGKLLVAVNQTLVPLDTPIKGGDEVAFFPPVTGG